MLNGVVFDLDGVIVDSHPAHKRSWQSFFLSLGKKVADSELDFIFEGRRRRDILVHFLGELSSSELQEYGNKKDELFRQEFRTLEPVAGSIDLIKELSERGLRLAVATSASKDRASWTLREFKIHHYFPVIVTGDDVPQSKPDPGIYRLVTQKLDVVAESLVAIEDSVCGVLSAKAAGLRCFGIASPPKDNELRAAGADRVLAKPGQISVRDLEDIFMASRETHPRGGTAHRLRFSGD